MPIDILRMQLTSNYLSSIVGEEVEWWEDFMIWVVGDKNRNMLEMAQKIQTMLERSFCNC